VVATGVGGTPDVVEDGADGMLVGVGDVDALAAALERLARDPELRRQFGEHGRERVIPRYRVERLVEDTDALYRELLSAKGLPLPAPARARAAAG
jgi:glycosyltransferase involved in cell wall biosynthesis